MSRLTMEALNDAARVILEWEPQSRLVGPSEWAHLAATDVRAGRLTLRQIEADYGRALRDRVAKLVHGRSVEPGTYRGRISSVTSPEYAGGLPPSDDVLDEEGSP